MKNSEILFIYEAVCTNPNGDPDAENRPRIDPASGRCLVTDVRLKRYIRDYIIDKFGEKYVWVSTVNGKSVTADERGRTLAEQWKDDPRIAELLKERGGKIPAWVELVPKLCLDARLFGATIPVKKKEGSETGASISFVGPVQFSLGFSLHPVELIESSSITSIFSGRETGYGTIGKDYRIYYGLIAFQGAVSGFRARGTGLRDIDVKALDDAIWDSIKLETISRSKIGQRPRLYLRVEYVDSETFIGEDFRKFLSVKHERKIRSMNDLKLGFSELVGLLEEHGEKIERIYVREEGIEWADGGRLIDALKSSKKLGDKVVELPHKEENLLERAVKYE